MEEFLMGQSSMDKPEAEKQAEDAKMPSIMQVGTLYSLAVLLMVFVSTRLQTKLGFNLGGALAEILLIMLPPLLFLILFKFDVKKVLRINKTGFMNFFLTFWIMLFSIPVVGLFNILNMVLVKLLFGTVEVSQVPVGNDAIGFLVSILVIGASAGICEELLFRGVIQRGFERLGTVKSILITAFLFGLLHFDFQKLFGTFALGALIGFLVYRSNSIFVGMFAHFTNNSIAVAALFLSMKMTEYMEKMGLSGANEMNTTNVGDVLGELSKLSGAQIAAVIIFYSVVFVFMAAIFGLLLYAFIKNTSKDVREIKEDRSSVKAVDFIALVPGILMVALIYVFNGLQMAGTVDVETLRSILKAIGIG
ncbi:MAG TPA: type II CAAX endopeptidase family protein [Acetivibrio sp.]|uniref:type II CAAX endopeptidase family protein n=1 Tax=Acetivibrio sp. TaxID=1872092 RepID=UPI002BB61968|nr:type II CAAX endopeptidase family protein [Acetivibrio sp.]HOM03584.1 type II CAAX endopeptidase family protein [Acetivibrio sp.]